MSDYDKIWIEVDVEKDRDKEEKTKKILAIIEALSRVESVINITKTQYQMTDYEEQE